MIDEYYWNPIKLYRYRSINELLFKELRYRELYSASPEELNDPLDLNVQLDFFTEIDSEIATLARYLSKITLSVALMRDNYTNLKELLSIIRPENLHQFLSFEFSNWQTGILAKHDLFELLKNYFSEHSPRGIGIGDKFVKEVLDYIDEKLSQILNTNTAVCFSKDNDNYKMWSHYASDHSGICLEFEVEQDIQNNQLCKFPINTPIPVNGEYINRKWEIKAVRYQTALTSLKFYDFVPVFYHVDDCDLKNISKSYWHPFANKLESILLEKTIHWQEEEEWRLVSVNFGKTSPEKNIFYFSAKALTGIYFGIRTTKQTRIRVRNAIGLSNCNPSYYQCKLDGTNQVIFEDSIEDE